MSNAAYTVRCKRCGEVIGGALVDYLGTASELVEFLLGFDSRDTISVETNVTITGCKCDSDGGQP